jgi:hypothetical protein
MFLEGFLSMLLGVLTDRSGTLPADLAGILDKIERALPSEAKCEARQPMVALYVLWHTFLKPQHHRPKAAEVIQRYKADLEAPSVQAFAVFVLTSVAVRWSTEQLVDLASIRRDDLRRGRGQPLPSRFNAVLFLCAAERLWSEQRVPEALSLIPEAVEALPGDEPLLAFEQDAQAGNLRPVALLDFVLAKHPWGPEAPLQGSPP